jgi:GNAT superfamily N-acetyltransferase
VPAPSRVRRATPTDVPAMVGLVHELARYERAAHECLLDVAGLEAALFAPSPALFGHVAVVDDEVVGLALWFLSFSTWRGVHGIYLEDLVVEPGHRGHGLGRDLLAALAAECVDHGWARLEWSVLDWNTPAVDFYRSLGAEPMSEWTVHRLTGEALGDLARRHPAGNSTDRRTVD